MNVFWRKEPLTEQESDLCDVLHDAHVSAVFRNNISSNVLINAFAGSGDYYKAVCAALLTLGGTHAPLYETFDLLISERLEDARNCMRAGGKVPGWGNGFVKGTPDPMLCDVDIHLERCNPRLYTQMGRITELLHKSGKKVFCNHSAYTAAVGLTVGMPRLALPYLLIEGRLAAWTNLLLGQVK